MRESEPPPNKTEIKKEKSFKEKERWADEALRVANKLKEDSLETKELKTASFTESERVVSGELKNILKKGEIHKIKDVLEEHHLNNTKEKDKLFGEFSLQEAAVQAAAQAINAGETTFAGDYDFTVYVLPKIISDPDFQEAVLKKTNEYIVQNDLYQAYSLIIQFLPEETVSKENFPLRIRQSLIRMLESDTFSIRDFQMGLYCFNKFTPARPPSWTEESPLESGTPEAQKKDPLLEPDMQQAAKKAITRLSKLGSNTPSVLSDILHLKELFHIE